MFNDHFMEIAIELAEKAYKSGEVPVGAVIVDRRKNKIISSAHNLSEKLSSPIMHAEILALNEASKHNDSKYLTDCDLYVTLEPCPLCAAAISMFRIGKLYFSAYDYKFGAVETVTNFFNSKNCLHKPEIYSGISCKKTSKLMINFFENLREKKS